MFEYIRTHQRLMQFLLLLIIFPSFAFFGIESFTRSRGAESAVATVDGQSVTQQEFDSAMREQLDRFRQAYGAQFDSKMLNTPEMKQEVLEQLLARKAVAAELVRNHMTISDQTLQQNILAIDAFHDKDGGFDKERYASLLAAQSMSQAVFEYRLRQDLLLQQLTGAIQGTTIVPKTVADQLSALNEQERHVQEITFKAADFSSQVKVSDAMLKAYYEKNSSQFEIPEQVTAEYVVLNRDVLAEQVSVSDAETQSYYEQNKKMFGTEEQRRASHILIALKKDSSAAETKAARAKADTLLSQLRSKPDMFAKLARENSQDPVSAERGGDLEFFGKGAMTKAFEEAAFKLKQNEISEVVQTEFGFHVILLTGIKPAEIQPLDEVRAQIVAEIKKQKAVKSYAEAAETFNNTVYEQSDSLKPVAEKLKLKIEVVSGLTRQGAPKAAAAGMSNAKFLKEIFSDDVVKKKHNTQGIEVAPSTLIAGRVVEHKAASTRPFEEVRDTIVARVTQAEAEALAKKAGEQKLAEVKANDSTAGFSAVKVVTRIKNEGIPGPAFTEIMKADIQKLPAFVGVNQPDNGYAIYRIGKVAAGAPDPARRQSELQQISNMLAQQDLSSYIDALKVKSKAKINKTALTSSEPSN